MPYIKYIFPILLMLLLVGFTYAQCPDGVESPTEPLFTIEKADNCHEYKFEIQNQQNNVSYAWNFGDGSPQVSGATATHLFNNLNDGNIFTTLVIATDNAYQNCFTSSQPVRHTVTPYAALDFDGYKLFNCNASTRDLAFENITDISEGNIEKYFIDWGDGTGMQEVNSEPKEYSYTEIGIFYLTYTVEDENGCTDTAVYELINSTNLSLTVSSEGNTVDCTPYTICFPINMEVIMDNPDIAQYTINFGDSTEDTIIYHIDLPEEICHEYKTPSCNGPFVFSMNSSINGRCSTGGTVDNIVIYDTPTPILLLEPSWCVNEPMILRNWAARRCAGQVFYTWTIINLNDNSQIEIEGFDGESFDYTFTESGLYEIELYVATYDFCEATSARQQICIGEDNEDLKIEMGINELEFCLGETIRLYSDIILSSDNLMCPIAYNWVVTAPDNSTVLDTTLTSDQPIEITDFTQTGLYNATLTYSSGCIVDQNLSLPFTIFGDSNIILPSPITICNNLNYTIEPTSSINIDAISYEVVDENETLIMSSSNGQLNFPNVGIYTIIATGESCGKMAIDSTTITIIDTSNPEDVSATTVCLNIAPIDLNQFAQGIWMGNDFIQNQNIFTPTTGGDYSLTVEQTLEGSCAVLRNFQLTVKAPPSFNYNMPDSVCLQNETMNLNITPTGGQWNNPNIDENGLLNLQEGSNNYTYVYTDAENICTADTTLTLQVYNVDDAIEEKTLIVCEGGEDIKLTSTILQGSWSGNSAIFEDGTIDVSDFTEGDSYTFYFTTPTCLFSDSIVVNVISNEPLLDVDTTVCTLDTLDLSAIFSGATFEGSDGIENNFFIPVLSDRTLNNITVIKDSGSCVATANILVEILPNPIAPKFVNEGPFCYNNNIQLNVTPVGGNFNCEVDYLTCDGMLMPNEPSSYEVIYQITNDDGCKNNVTRDIVVNALPNVAINASNQQACIGESIELNATNPNEGNCEWQISGSTFSDCSINFEGINAGEYIAHLTQTNNNCAATDSITIKINDALNITQLESNDFLCVPGTAEIAFDFTGDADNIIWNIDGAVFSGEIAQYTLDPVLNDTLTATINVIINNGCDADTANHDILLSPKPQINFLADSAKICSGTEVSFHNGTLGNPYSTRWFVNGNLVSTDFELAAQAFYAENDTIITYHEILLEASNNCGTLTKKDTITVYPKIVKAFLQPAFSGAVVCVGDEIFFREASTNAINLQWEFNGDSLIDSYSQDSTSFTYNTPGNYTVTLTADDGCGRAIDTLNLEVAPLPVVTMSFEDDTPCIDDDVEIFSEIEGEIGSIEWIVNGSSISTYINTRATFRNIGENTIELIVTSPAGCVTAITETIFVDTPLPSIMVENSVEYPCVGSIQLLSATTIDGEGIIWTINNDTIGSGNTFNYNVNDLNPVDIILHTKNICGEMSETIRIEPQPTPNIQLIEPLLIGDCYNQQFQFGFESSTQNLNVLWNFGDGNTSTDFNPIHTYLTEDAYNITLMVGEVEYGCKADASTTVFTYNAPSLIGLNDTTVCDGQEIYLPFTATNANEIVLMVDGQVIQSNPNVLPVFYNEDTDIEVIVYYENTTTGCNETSSATVTVCKLPEPIFSFSNNEPNLNELITIINESDVDLNDETEWYVNGVLTDIENGIYFSENGTYIFELMITEGTCDCVTSSQQSITINGPYTIKTPNAMAPDQLSYFKPIGQGIDNYTMSIYTKWGELVYNTPNIVPVDGNFESEWNGQWNNNGENLPQGVYAFEILVKYYNEKEDKIFGTVTLLR